MSLRFLGEDVVSRRVRQRRFDVDCDGRIVPGNLWTPTDDGDDNGDGDGGRSPRPLVLIGHGAGTSKSEPYVVSLARRFVRHHGYAAAAVDGPLHGDRRDDGGGFAISFVEFGQAWANEPDLIDESVAEWTAALDALAALPDVGAGPVGYWGVSMGTAIGVPFVAQQPKITCAVFGLAGLRPNAADFEAAAKAIIIPVEFVFQWEDAVAPRETGLALFNAFGSAEKTMHINPGGHMDIPGFEGASWERFYVRHLGAADAPAKAKQAVAAAG